MTPEEKMRKLQGARLRTIRMAAGYTSARAAAKDAGWAESTYRAHEGGTRTIDPGDAARYVLFFLNKGAKGDDFTGRWIIYGDDDDLYAGSLDDLVAGESPAFRKKAFEAILNLKKR